MSITVGDILKVVVSLVWDDGEINQNVYNAVISGTGGPYDDTDIVDDGEDWADVLYSNLYPYMDPEIAGSHVTVYVYDPADDDWDEVGTNAWGLSCTGATNALPRGVAGLVNARTLNPDVQGKKYLPGLIEGICDQGLWQSAGTAAFLAFALDWVTAFTGATSGASWIPVVWSVANTVATAMSGEVTIPTIPAYQRRRKQGVGI